MALSILRLAPGGNCMLYDSDRQEAILTGNREDLQEWKDKMDECSQMAANRVYFDNLRYERMGLLVAAGHTEESATEFLKKNMSYLYE